MTTALDHPFTKTVYDAGLGHFPPADRGAEVGPALPGPCDAVCFFAEHVVLAADVSQDWVRGQLTDLGGDERDPATGLGRFIGALAAQLGHPPVSASLLSVAPYQAAFLHGKIEPGGQADVAWAAYREDVRAYRYTGVGGVEGTFALGRGPGGRWDVFLRVDEQAGGGRASRELLTAARTIVPEHTLLFASAPLHHIRVLRAVLGSGFRPLCTEVLLLTRGS